MSKQKQKRVYVVLKGAKPGIYYQWQGDGGAEQQVKGYPKAVYKSFATVIEAVEWVRKLGGENLAGELSWMELQPSAPTMGNQERVEPEPTISSDELRELLHNDKVVIFTDGAAIGNPGPGGYGVVLLSKERRREIWGGYRQTTNNRMEIFACIAGLEALKFRCSVVLYSDSRYVVDTMREGWAKRWQGKGWYRTTKEKAKNADLWERLLALCDLHDVQFRWVRGHAGQPENERCDELSVAAAEQPDLPPDQGYESGAESAPRLF